MRGLQDQHQGRRALQPPGAGLQFLDHRGQHQDPERRERDQKARAPGIAAPPHPPGAVHQNQGQAHRGDGNGLAAVAAPEGHKGEHAGDEQRGVQEYAAIGAEHQAPEALPDRRRKAFAAVEVIAGVKRAAKADLVVEQRATPPATTSGTAKASQPAQPPCRCQMAGACSTPVDHAPDQQDGNQHGVRVHRGDRHAGADARHDIQHQRAGLPPGQQPVETDQQAECAERLAKELLGIGPGNRGQTKEQPEQHARAVTIAEPHGRQPQQGGRPGRDDGVQEQRRLQLADLDVETA